MPISIDDFMPILISETAEEFEANTEHLEPSPNETQIRLESLESTNEAVTTLKPVQGSQYLESFSSKCGLLYGSRIFGGTQVNDHGYPWAAAIGFKPTRGPKRIICGGALITDQVNSTSFCGT